MFRYLMSKCIPYITLLIFLLIPSNTYAIQKKVYQVTDAQQLFFNSSSQVLWYTFVHIPWKSGRVVISSDPNGENPAAIGPLFGVYANGSNSEKFVFDADCGQVKMPPLDITHIMGPMYSGGGGGDTSLLIKYYSNFCSGEKIYVEGVKKFVFNIDPLYIVHFDDFEISNAPFLDLPWDYESDGNIFQEVALTMTSYFDHEYPLLSISMLNEPVQANSSIIPFYSNKQFINLSYTEHDGYDFAYASGARLGDSVLAAAPGTATYRYDKWSGNAILIDHGNGYQTRYYHLSEQDLVLKDKNKSIAVSDRQQIGRIGFTGNVLPVGAAGTHIHFMVIKDKDENGNFDDNIPDGLVDPFGWQGDGEDPWESYKFEYNGKSRIGAKSTYLWKNNLSSARKTLTPIGASILDSGANVTAIFPKDAVKNDVFLDIATIAPIVRVLLDDKIQTNIRSIGNGVKIIASDVFGNLITKFTKTYTIRFALDPLQFLRFDKNSISIYSRSDGAANWKMELSTTDLETGVVETAVDHLTEFAVFGKYLDTIPPVTKMTFESGKLEFLTIDEPADDSIGVAYTYVKIGNDDWQLYKNPIEVNGSDKYEIQFYSADFDGNVETIKSEIINKKQPTTSTPTPITNSKQLTSDNQQPTTSTPTPITNSKQLTSDNQQPTTKNKQLTTSIPEVKGLTTNKDYVVKTKPKIWLKILSIIIIIIFIIIVIYGYKIKKNNFSPLKNLLK